ncbi:sugar transferase [Pseudobacillus wudalianchiensis]|uniref:sugar transferase n=1 Tax=Pseudobacillus wudalianchiensis TaxID=1743143 RepID=UPI000A55A95A|nr:sugar transferase [Bacillus wudalianchiensis]
MSKRIFDIIASSFILILISPILGYVALRIKLEDNGPVIFKQKRAGLNDRPFLIYKFRSMKVINRQKDKQENLYNWPDRVPDDFVFKTTTGFNPNVTKIGRFIRKYSIDELPQFINVLKGEMSIVGPRPEIIEISSCYDDYQAQRLFVKPGITGWAQVNGRSEISHGEKIAYDLYYVKHQSLVLDFKIFFKTVYQAIFGKGAI